jgi:hypothetical protein
LRLAYVVPRRCSMLKVPLTGAAQSPTDSVKRAMDFLRSKEGPRPAARPQPGDPEWRPEGRSERR